VIPGIFQKLYQVFNEAVFPPKCLACRTFFPATAPVNETVSRPAGGNQPAELPSMQSRLDSLLSRYLCPACIRGLSVVESPICTCCGLPFKSRQGDDHLCAECMDLPKKFRIARAALVYEPVLTSIIHRFKYQGKIQLADPLAELLGAAFRHYWGQDTIDMIIPVPLHLKRLRQRGFNQVYLLVRNWTAASGPNGSGRNFQIERDVLARKVFTKPQSALGRTARALNIKNAFTLIDSDKIIGKRILMIDDVYTTGATVNECARLLLKHGAEHVDVLTLARAV
jgi:ComF family protein